MRFISTLNVVVLYLALGSTVQADPEFFGESETLPALGPRIGKSLPYNLPVEMVNKTQRSSISNSLE